MTKSWSIHLRLVQREFDSTFAIGIAIPIADILEVIADIPEVITDIVEVIADIQEVITDRLNMDGL